MSPIGIPTIGADDRQTAAATIRAVVSDGEILCRTLSREVVVRTWRGIANARSGDILMIPEEPNFVNDGLTHATRFDYTQEVPLFLYGPGYVRLGIYRTPVTLADLAPHPRRPARVRLRHEGWRGALGGPVARVRASDPRSRPHPDLGLRGPQRAGAVAGRMAGPAIPAHAGSMVLRRDGRCLSVQHAGRDATIGTGTFPRRHGLVDVYLRIGGQIQEPNEFGPSPLRVPTLADLYDLDTGNEAVVGTVATLSDHLMMMSHGAEWPGGDLNIAITRELARGPTTGIEAAAWNLTEGDGAALPAACLRERAAADRGCSTSRTRLPRSNARSSWSSRHRPRDCRPPAWE